MRNTSPARRLEIARNQVQRWQQLLDSQPAAPSMLRQVWAAQVAYWQRQVRVWATRSGVKA
jgi:hypothetical protein